MDEKFWEDGVKVIDHEESIHSSPSSRLSAKLILAPLFFFTAFGVPVLWLTSGDAKMIVAGILFGGLPFAMVLLTIYGVYITAHTDYALRINSVSGTIEEIYTRKDKVERDVYPIKEAMRISLSDPNSSEGESHISIKGMNIRGVKWSVDLSHFAWGTLQTRRAIVGPAENRFHQNGRTLCRNAGCRNWKLADSVKCFTPFAP